MPRKRRRPRQATVHAAVSKEIKCVKCGETKTQEFFVRDSTRATGHFPWCKVCVLKNRKERQAQGPFTTRERTNRQCPGCLAFIPDTAHPNRRFCSDKCKDRVQRWKVFGLAPEEFHELTKSGRCPICDNKVKRWAVDHNHTTMETYGPICQICNQTLVAYSKHKVEIAQRLVEFLENPPVRRMFGEKRYIGPESVSQIDRLWMWGAVNADG